MKALVAAAALACAVSLPTWAANISVTDAWARATVPGQKVSGAYMRIQSDADARLVSASSPAVPRVEVHEMKMDGDVMRMREVKAIELPKGKTVSLEPGGYHIMLMNLTKPIAAGEQVVEQRVAGLQDHRRIRMAALGRDLLQCGAPAQGAGFQQAQQPCG